MKRRSSAQFEAKNGNTEARLWENAKYCAANKLSKNSEGIKLKANFIDKVLCRPRKTSVVERINQQKVKYLDLADSNPLITGPMKKPGNHHNRKLAVSERTKFDREMIFEMILHYQQVAALEEWLLL